MEKNMYRLGGMVAGALLSWALTGSLLATAPGALLGLFVQAMVTIAFMPGVNVRHKVKRILRASEGAKICVTPYTRGRLSYFTREYGLALRDKPVTITIDSYNIITLEKLAV